MRRSEIRDLSEPGKVPGGRFMSASPPAASAESSRIAQRGVRGPGRARAWAWRALAFLAVLILEMPGMTTSPARSQQGDRLQEGTVTEVRIDGNVSITTEKVRAKILSRAGQPLDQAKVEADLKS